MALLSGKFRSYEKAISLFDWQVSLNNFDVNEKVSVFIETTINVMSHFVPNELITSDDRDQPWTSRYIKSLIVP